MIRKALFVAFLCLQACLSVGRERNPRDTFDLEREVLDPDLTIAHNKAMLRYCAAIDSPDGAFMACIGIAIKYWEKQISDSSRFWADSSIKWGRRSTIKDAVAWGYNNIAGSYYEEGDYLTASQYLHIAIEELKKSCPDDPNHTWANVYNSLGDINMRLNQPEKAIEYFKLAESVCLRGRLYFQLGENYTERGIYCNKIGKHDSAIWFFNKVMELGKRINKRDLQAIAYCNLGRTAMEIGRYDEAVANLQHSLDLARGIYYYITTDALYAMGDVLGRQGKYREAEAILLQALQKTKEYRRPDLSVEVYKKLVVLYKTTGRYKEALSYTDSLVTLKEQIAGVSKTTAYNQLELKYKTVEKDKELAQNQLLIARQQSKITRKNIWIGAIAGGIVLLAIVVLSYLRNVRDKQRLQAEQIKSLQQENRIGTLNAVVHGEENERGRIARELHDGIGGMLAAAMMRLGTIKHEHEDVTASAGYREGMDMLDQMGDEIRKTAHNLMPEVLQKQNLAEAVRSFCSYMQERDGLKIDFQSYGKFDELPGNMKLHLYRIVQELLKNIKQHAVAHSALVQLMLNEQTLAITVEDNGKGFDTETVKKGIGLHNVQTRVQNLGGHCTIESAEGRGTTVYIEFEIQKTPQN